MILVSQLEITGIPIAAVLTVSVTLFVFFAGQIFNGISKAINRVRNRKFNRVVVIAQVPRLIKEIDERVAHYKEYANGMATDVIKAGNIALYNQPELDILLSIRYLEMNKAFFEGFFNNDINEKNTQIFCNFWGSLCTIDDLNKRAFEIQNSYSDLLKIYFRETEISKHNILTIIEKLIIKFRDLNTKDTELLGYIQKFGDIYTKDAYKLTNKLPSKADNIYEQFILLNKIFKNVKYNIDVECDLTKFNDLLRVESNLYFLFQSEIEALKGTLLSTIEIYERCVKELEQFFKQFQ